MGDSLRDRLNEVGLVSELIYMPEDPYPSLAMRGREEATDLALKVFVEWLRDCADGYGSTPWVDGACHIVKELTNLADALEIE